MNPAPAFEPEVDAPVLVALSGGMDSTALLHALVGSQRQRARGLRALHVHHGLHPAADGWATHCAQACAALGIALDVEHVDTTAHAGQGREGAARAARHAAFKRHLRDGECLALAHHQDDQAETFLLRALHASGVDGLAAMPAMRPLGRGMLWRPWLGTPRAAIADFARRAELTWIDDPSNADATLDRNFLRHEVLPLLRRRWPGCDAALSRAASQARDARALLEADDAHLLGLLMDRSGTLCAKALGRHVPARRARLLRRWIAARGLPPLPGAGIDAVESWLAAGRRDAQPRFDWAGACLRLWRDRLHAAQRIEPLPASFDVPWDGSAPLPLPGGGELAITPALRMEGMRVRARRGGERIRLASRSHRHLLKHLLQEAGLPPWEREHLPLLSAADGELLAAGDRILSARLQEMLAGSGARVHWRLPGSASGD